MKRRFLVSSVVLLMSFLIASTSFAGAKYCSTATVTYVGTATTGYVVFLRNDSGAAVGVNNGWAKGATLPFFLSDSIKDSGLATALTAISLNKTVLAGTSDGTYASSQYWDVISGIYVAK